MSTSSSCYCAWYNRLFAAVYVLVPHHVPTPTRGMTVRARPTRTRTLTLWGDQGLDAVACEGSRFMRPTLMLCLEGLFWADSAGSRYYVGCKAEDSRNSRVTSIRIYIRAYVINGTHKNVSLSKAHTESSATRYSVWRKGCSVRKKNTTGLFWKEKKSCIRDGQSCRINHEKL